LKALDEAAAQYNVSQSAIALAWLIARPSVTAPIVSATNLDQLKEFVTAASLKLSDETIEALNTASAY